MIYMHEPVPCPWTPKDPRAARVFKRGIPFTHLTADTEAELVAFGKTIGMREAWLQKKGFPEFHFDITGEKLRKCQASKEVILLDMSVYLARMRNKDFATFLVDALTKRLSKTGSKHSRKPITTRTSRREPRK